MNTVYYLPKGNVRLVEVLYNSWDPQVISSQSLMAQDGHSLKHISKLSWIQRDSPRFCAKSCCPGKPATCPNVYQSGVYVALAVKCENWRDVPVAVHQLPLRAAFLHLQRYQWRETRHRLVALLRYGKCLLGDGREQLPYVQDRI